jgi:glycosyltransferase involved in cell wall biosynthesis
MNACITVEHRFERTRDGAVWTRSNHSYEELRRYLDVFDSVRIIARVRDVPAPPATGLRADGNRLSFAPIPCYIGFEQFCMRWRSVQRAALNGIGDSDAVILKAPSVISCMVEPMLRWRGRPFAVEVIADPRKIYSRGSINHPLRPLLRSVFTWRTRSQCLRACAVRYVGNHLQAEYASNPGAFQTAVSDVHIPADALVLAARRTPRSPAPLSLIAVGSLEQPYKGIDVLLRALRLCVAAGFDCRLVVVGEGRCRAELTNLAAQLGLTNRVDFRGSLPGGKEVFAALDECDMFVMPSRQEGMPRAMIEAMARALPCIGSRVGGIPQLLDAENLVSPGDPRELAEKIIEVGKSPDLMERMSRRCLERARDFQDQKLGDRARSFLTHLRDATESWSATQLRNVEATARI